MRRNNTECIEMEGWLSLHGQPGFARLTKAELSSTALKLFVLNVPSTRALRPAVRPTSALTHVNCAVPHPALHAAPPSPEAIAHQILFNTLLPPPNYNAEILLVDCCALLAKVRAYIELCPHLVPESAPLVFTPTELLQRVVTLVESVLGFRSLLTEPVVAELLALCTALPVLDRREPAQPQPAQPVEETTPTKSISSRHASASPAKLDFSSRDRNPSQLSLNSDASQLVGPPILTEAYDSSRKNSFSSIEKETPVKPVSGPVVSGPVGPVGHVAPTIPVGPVSTVSDFSPTLLPMFPTSLDISGEGAASVAEKLAAVIRSTAEKASATLRLPGCEHVNTHFDAVLDELATSSPTLPLSLLKNSEFLAVFSDQLALFHQTVWSVWSPLIDASLLFHKPYSCTAWKTNPLVFDSEYPHFIGAAAASSILNPEIDESVRAIQLAAWIRIGSRLRQLGDIVGWSALVLTLVSPAVLRLETWRFLDLEFLHQYASDWNLKAFEMQKRAREPFLQKRSFRVDCETVGKTYPKQRCVPYFGDAIITEQAENMTLANTREKLSRIRIRMEGWTAFFQKVEDSCLVEPLPPKLASFQALFQRWARPAERPDTFALSLLVNPRTLGAYLPYFYTQPLPLTQGGLLPILFVDSLPSFRLYPRNTLLMVNQPKQNSRPKAVLRRSSSFPPSAYPLTTGVTELDCTAGERLERAASAHVLARVVRDLLNVGTETIDTHLDLVFKAFNEELSTKKRHSSSIVESFGTALGGQLVVVKSASLLRLVDVLVLGAGVFGSELRLDAQLHLSTLLTTFRTMCSPAEMIDMLLLRIRGARQVSSQLQDPRSPKLWLQADPSLEPDDTAVRVVSAIIKMMQKWVSEFFFDFQDDAGALEQGRALVLTLLHEVTTYAYPDKLEQYTRQVLYTFDRNQFSNVSGPQLPSWHACLASKDAHTAPIASPPTPRTEKPEDVSACNAFIDELNTIVQDAFSRVTLTDWMRLHELLEVQTASLTGLFAYTPQQSASSDDVVIEDIYSWLSSLHSPSASTRVLDQLPKPITMLVRLHFGLVAYLTHLIADPKASSHARLLRMVFLLKTLGALRARMRFFDLIPDEETSKRQHVPSFLERALAAAVLRPESRAYASLWLQAGSEVARFFPAEDGPSVVPNAKHIFVPAVPCERGEPIVPCVGWIVERLLEITCCVPNTSIEHPQLINFDKRRFGYNLIQNICQEFQSSAPVTAPSELVSKYMCVFGEAAQTASIPLLFDRKQHRESVQREGRSRAKVFVDIVQQEHERTVLEARQLEKLEKQGSSKTALGFYRSHGSESSTSLYSKRFSILSPAPNDTASLSDSIRLSSSGSISGSASSKRGTATTPKKSRFGGFLKAVRPLSVLGSSSSSIHISQPSNSSTSPMPAAGSTERGSPRLNPADSAAPPSASDPWELDSSISLDNLASRLDVIPDDLVLFRGMHTECISTVGLADASGEVVSIVYKGSQPKPETITLRAPTRTAAEEWITAIHRVVRSSQLASTRVFGVALDIVCKRESSMVPRCLEILLSQVEERGLDEVGVYRISGSMASVNALKQLFDQGVTNLASDDPRWADINTVAGCIKLYLRELPESILTPQLLQEFLECCAGPEFNTEKLEATIAKLPSVNYCVLKRLIEHLKLVVDHSDVNKMNMQNIAIVFSINFLPPMAMSLMGGMQQIISTMILEKDSLFTK